MKGGGKNKVACIRGCYTGYSGTFGSPYKLRVARIRGYVACITIALYQRYHLLGPHIDLDDLHWKQCLTLVLESIVGLVHYAAVFCVIPPLVGWCTLYPGATYSHSTAVGALAEECGRPIFLLLSPTLSELVSGLLRVVLTTYTLNDLSWRLGGVYICSGRLELVGIRSVTVIFFKSSLCLHFSSQYRGCHIGLAVSSTRIA